MSRFQATWLIASREAKERARSKAFLASTLLTILLLGGVIAVAALTNGGPPHYGVALVGDSPASLQDALSLAATASDAFVDPSPITDPEAVADAIESGELDAAIVDDDTILLAEDAPDHLETILEIGLRQARLLDRLASVGIDPATAASMFGSDESISVVRAGAEDEGGGEAIAVAAVVLLFIVITTYGQWVLMGVLEEKSTRVVELIASSTSIRSLLAGKVIGIGLLGLGQLAVLIALGLTAGSVFDLFEMPSGTVATALWSLLWFILGFAFYASLNAAAGSLVSRTEDAQAAATPIALVAVASYLLTFTVIMQQPGSLLSTLLSLLPPIAPIAFPARIGFVGVPLWEIGAGIVVMVLSVVAVVQLSGRIYAGALLASGGKVKIRDAWRSAAELTARR